MSIKKNFSAPLASELGATRRAAMLLLVMMLTTATAWATDKTLSGSESYTAQDGDMLTGSTSGTVTIANNAKITLSDVTITGGIVCAGTAEITLAGTNNVSGATYKAGIQIGGSGTTLTIKGNGSLTANGGENSAGIGLSRAWKVNATGGDIVIEGGNITATGDGMGAGIGTGVSYGNGTDNTATIGNITIKGGTVRAIGGTNNSYPGNGIGKGGAYSYGHAVVGTITIYDGIDMVDASSISESVTYMHVENETETDVTANKSDYFTITEDGNRRVIEPKDDTDYTITIANGIEHGTLTGAATAKYTEKVTITATPALGYRFSRLVVKDAQNNDVASTGNSFFMPKSNVTVSAVFEQGTHGTTEFAWGYYLGSYVTEATIYDGVTTVELQQGKKYFIGKDYQEGPEPGKGFYENEFRPDEDPYARGRDIPYSGGTGSFMGGGYGEFTLNGDAGYYDITMTDVGNGKWNVSILKTAGQMDVVPDQTYTGSAITPEPLVIAGSLNLTKGTDYVYSYTNNTNVGTATVRATFQDTYAWLGSVEKEFTILPSTVIVNVTGNGTVTCGDRSATDGTSFGVMSEKGASVVLTLAPTDGYAARSVAYGYTNNSGTTASGIKLPISGTTATLTVPDDLKDGTGVTVTVTFAPALNGGADEASAVALTDATVTDLGGGWYKVDSDISFDHTLNLLGDTHLIIADGKTMTVNTASNRGIYSDYTLFVSGEGTLSVTTTGNYGIAVCVGNYVQTGATVTASGSYGIRCTDDFIAFNFTNDFTFSGGQLTATGNSGGIWADNDITLSCTNATDFIQASSYSSGYGAVKIAEGKTLVDDYGVIWSGALYNNQIHDINDRTLKPLDYTGVTLTKEYYNVSATFDGTSETTVSIPVDVNVTSVIYNRTFTEGKPSTVMLPFNKAVSDISGGTFYTFGGMKKENDKWVATMNEVTGFIEANTPYLVMPAGTSLTFSGGATLNTTCDGQTAEYDGFELRGTYTEKVWEENDPEIGKAYVYNANGELVPVAAGTRIRPTECYIIQTKKRLDGKDITVSIPAMEWTGTEVAFDASTVKVWDGTTLLTQTTDYTVTAPTGTLQNTGDYPVTITGAGEYIGTKEAMFTIKGAPITIKNEANEDVQSVDNAYTITTDQRGGATLTLVTPEPTTPETPPTIVTVDIPTPVVVDHVDLDRIFEAGKACTLYLPFSIGVDKLAGGTFNTFVGVNTAVTPWEVQYSEVKTGTIEANTPYIFIPDGSNGGKIVVNNGKDKISVCTANQHTTENGQWDFIGTYERIKWTHNTSDPEYTAAREAEIGSIYGFAAEEKSGATVGQFVKVGNNVFINPMRAYLKYSEAPAPARSMDGNAATTELPSSMKVVIVAETTGISDATRLNDNVKLINDNEAGAWYSLDGRKLQGKPTTKGMYIHNGRKEVVK